MNHVALSSAFKWLSETLVGTTQQFLDYRLHQTHLHQVTLQDSKLKKLVLNFKNPQIDATFFYSVIVMYPVQSIPDIPDSYERKLVEFDASITYDCIKQQSYRGHAHVYSPEKEKLQHDDKYNVFVEAVITLTPSMFDYHHAVRTLSFPSFSNCMNMLFQSGVPTFCFLNIMLYLVDSDFKWMGLITEKDWWNTCVTYE